MELVAGLTAWLAIAVTFRLAGMMLIMMLLGIGAEVVPAVTQCAAMGLTLRLNETAETVVMMMCQGTAWEAVVTGPLSVSEVEQVRSSRLHQLQLLPLPLILPLQQLSGTLLVWTTVTVLKALWQRLVKHALPSQAAIVMCSTRVARACAQGAGMLPAAVLPWSRIGKATTEHRIWQ